eukprot:1224057-Rhodomonas_salina.1
MPSRSAALQSTSPAPYLKMGSKQARTTCSSWCWRYGEPLRAATHLLSLLFTLAFSAAQLPFSAISTPKYL